MRLVVMRHGATAANDARRYAGRRTDEPLSPTGVGQCRAAGVCEQVRTVYASPLQRAVQTARLCFPNASVVPVPGLEEFDFGAFEGRTAQEMEQDEAYRAWVEGGCVGTCPNGESLEEFRARTRAALCGVLRNAARSKEEQVVVVAHGGTVMAAVDGFFNRGVGNCEGYVATVRLGGNDFRTTHLQRFRTLPW